MGGEAMSFWKATDIATGKVIYDSHRDGLDEEREEYLAEWDAIVERLEKDPKTQKTAISLREVATKRENEEERSFEMERYLGQTPKE
jgi:hypothetical protein